MPGPRKLRLWPDPRDAELFTDLVPVHGWRPRVYGQRPFPCFCHGLWLIFSHIFCRRCAPNAPLGGGHRLGGCGFVNGDLKTTGVAHALLPALFVVVASEACALYQRYIMCTDRHVSLIHEGSLLAPDNATCCACNTYTHMRVRMVASQ